MEKKEYEWDDKKNKINIHKHGISFDEAKLALEDPFAIEFYDEANSTLEEDRYICFGNIGDFIIVVVVYTDRKRKIRLVTARLAEPIEKAVYYENFKRATGRN